MVKLNMKLVKYFSINIFTQ